MPAMAGIHPPSLSFFESFLLKSKKKLLFFKSEVFFQTLTTLRTTSIFWTENKIIFKKSCFVICADFVRIYSSGLKMRTSKIKHDLV